MRLYSRLLGADPALRGWMEGYQTPVKRGDAGNHISRIQTALLMVEDLDVSSGELARRAFGVSTQLAITEFMRRRSLVNRGWQWQVTDVLSAEVMMTLDREVCSIEAESTAEDEAADFAWTTRKGHGRFA